MKKRVFLLIIYLVISQILLIAQESVSFNISFNREDFDFCSQENDYYVVCNNRNFIYSSDTTQFALPIITVNYLIGSNQKLFNYQIERAESEIIQNISLCQAPSRMYYDNTLNRLVKNPNQNICNFQLDSTVKYVGEHIIDGVKFLSYAICPFRYDDNSKQLVLIKSINFDLTLINDNTSSPLIPKKKSKELVSKIVENPASINSLYQVTNVLTSNHIEYVIVTTHQFAQFFKPLADWKTKKGIKTKIITIEEIENNYQGRTTQLKIKKALKDLYEQHGISYVMLGGNIFNLPSQPILREDDIDNQESTFSYYYSDYYYSCLNSMDWDEDAIYTYGTTEPIDLSPYYVVTRVPANDSIAVNRYVSKILEYEKSPNTDFWNKSILLGGKEMNEKSNYTFGQYSDAHVYQEQKYNNFIHPFWNGSAVKFYDSFADNYPVNSFFKNNLVSELQKGYMFADILTHGSESGWQVQKTSNSLMMVPEKYSNVDAEEQISQSYTTIITNACKVCNYDNDISFGESFICKNQRGKFVSFLGHSYLSIFTPLSAELTNTIKILSCVYKDLFCSSSKQLSQSLFNVLIENIGFADYDKHIRNDILFLTLLSDAELPLYVDIPNRFENIDIDYNQNGLTINTGLDDCRICISEKETNGDLYCKVFNNCQECTIANITRDCYICISKPGYIPYITEFDKELYIQNTSFTTDTQINAGEVFVGYNVTDQLQNGNVVIERGTLKINSINGVTIKNGFEIKKGATLLIN